MGDGGMGRWGDGEMGRIAAMTRQTSALELDWWYNEAGYIYFQLTVESIERWLNYIHDLPLNLQLNRDCQSRAASVALYAHARCCSVLKLAAAAKLVTITDDWQVVTPELARQSGKNPFGAAASHFEHPAEQQLIQVLMRVLDGIYEQSWLDSVQFVNQPHGQRQSPNWHKLTLDLAQSWLDFYRDCRILGEIKSQNPQLAIARCGLSAIARRYLQLLLENYLGISAAIEM